MNTKETVLKFVRDANPQTISDWEREGCQAFTDICGQKDEEGKWLCRYCRYWNGQQRVEKSYADMGLQELLIALRKVRNSTSHEWMILHGNEELTPYDLTKNLHSQSDSFYEGILPLLPTP